MLSNQVRVYIKLPTDRSRHIVTYTSIELTLNWQADEMKISSTAALLCLIGAAYSMPADAPAQNVTDVDAVATNATVEAEIGLTKLFAKAGTNQLSTRQYAVYSSTNYCIVGKLYMAVQGATAHQCKGCAAYVQCLGSQQATSLCRTDLQPGATDDISLEDDRSSEELGFGGHSGEGHGRRSLVVAKQGLPVDNIADAVKSVTRSNQWERYLNNVIGIRVNHEANRHGRFGRNCYALYGMFRGCLMPSLCLGYASV